MADIISTRRASLEAAMAAQSQALLDAMNEDRAEMKRLLKEIYNYNTHDLDATAAADGSAAPWSVEQHNGFMAKLHYWSREQLAGKAAALASYRDEYAAAAASAVDQAEGQLLNANRQVEDQRDAAEVAITRMVEDQLAQLSAFEEMELGLAKDARANLEALVASQVEGFRKQVIYSLHVLRFAGGYDVEQTGFGVGASSYYGNGNALTGVDELDNFRLGNPHGYAQVADKHSDDLEVALDAARDGVAQVVADARVEAAEGVAAAQETMRAEGARRLGLVLDAAQAILQAQADLVAQVEGEMAAANGARKDAMARLTGARVEAGEAICDVNLGKVDAWIEDRLAWAAKMPDSYRKKHLVQELKDTQAKMHEEFDALRAELVRDAQAANDGLWVSLGAIAQDLADVNAAQVAGLTATVSAAAQDMEAGVDAIVADFVFKTNRGLAAFNENMDTVLQNWAYWLKYTYGYQGYEQSLYQDFDPTQNYSDIMGYPSGDGAYSDLGTQGPDLANSGEANLPAGGFGVGGRGGIDYLNSGDETAEAYGKFIGPDKKFFDGSILDPLDDTKGMIDGLLSRYH